MISSDPKPFKASCSSSAGNRPASRSSAASRSASSTDAPSIAVTDFSVLVVMVVLSRPHDRIKSPTPHTLHRTLPEVEAIARAASSLIGFQADLPNEMWQADIERHEALWTVR